MADAADSPGAFAFGTPFEEQIKFFRAKLRLPTERWDDIMRSANDRAFIVAGAAKADLLQDLQTAVGQAMEAGSLAEFRKQFKAVVAKNGWTGWRGEGSAAGEAWRTRIIYQTNMATSYAAGRRQQMDDPEVAAVRPYWRYDHSDGVLHPRPLHLSWDGLTLPRDHEFWKTHFAPNGWGCRCEIFPVKAPAAGAMTKPPAGWDTLDPKTGAPVGIDKGFDYAPGVNATTPLAELVEQKLFNLSAPIGAQMAAAMEPVLRAERAAHWVSMVNRVAANKQANGETLLAGTVPAEVVDALAARDVVLKNAAVWLRDHDLLHAIRDDKKAPLTLEEWRQMPALLQAGRFFWDAEQPGLVYAIELDRADADSVGKVVVRVNFNESVRLKGRRERIESNFITTGGLVMRSNLDPVRYQPLGA